MSPKNNITIPWPFAPGSVRHNQDTNLLKIIAIVSMVIDHVGAILFPEHRLFRVIGRISFPLFAYCMSVGCVYTRNMTRYVSRIALLALVSQPIYALAFGDVRLAAFSFSTDPVRAAWDFYAASWADPSIFPTLLVGMLVCWTLKEQRPILTAALLLFAYLAREPLNYRMWGVVLVALFYVTSSMKYTGWIVMAAYMLAWAFFGVGYRYTLFGYSFTTQIFALFALPLIYIPMRSGIRLSPTLSYAFYPAHLVVLYLIDFYLA